MWFDSDIDAIMTRHVTRPIPSRRGGRAKKPSPWALINVGRLGHAGLWLASNWLGGPARVFHFLLWSHLHDVLKR